MKKNIIKIYYKIESYLNGWLFFNWIGQNKDYIIRKEVLSLDRKDIFQAIELERDRQDNMYPMSKAKRTGDKETDLLLGLLHHYEMLSILVEEVGEVGTALQGSGDLKEELIQVASVCCKWLENLK